MSLTLSLQVTKFIDLCSHGRQEDIYLSSCRYYLLLTQLSHVKWLRFILMASRHRLWPLVNMSFNLGLLVVWDTSGVCRVTLISGSEPINGLSTYAAHWDENLTFTRGDCKPWATETYGRAQSSPHLYLLPCGNQRWCSFCPTEVPMLGE